MVKTAFLAVLAIFEVSGHFCPVFVGQKWLETGPRRFRIFAEKPFLHRFFREIRIWPVLAKSVNFAKKAMQERLFGENTEIELYGP